MRVARPAADVAAPIEASAPWWDLGDAPDAFGRRALQRLLRRMLLSDAVGDLVVAYLPMRFHLVAAAVRGWDATFSIVLWRVAVPYAGAGGAYAAAVRKIRMPVRIDFHAKAFMFPAGLGLLMSRALERSSYPCGDAVFWDLLSGDEVLRIQGVHLAGVAPGGDAAAGIGPAAEGLAFGMWNIRSGELLWQGQPNAPARGRVRWCPRAAFSPGGKLVAALVGREFEGFQEQWSVEIWDARVGEHLCSWEAPARSRFLYGILAHILAFDGRTVTICRGGSGPASLLQVERSAGKCVLVEAPGDAACQDVLKTGELQLHIAGRAANVTPVTRKEDAVHHAKLPELRGPSVWTTGQFSPDGRKAVLSRGPCDTFVWPFADGQPPNRIGECVWEAAFSTDSQLLAGAVGDEASGAQEVVVFGLDARPVLRLPGAADVKYLQVAVRGDRAW